jgi:hypothetical protein
MTLRVMPIAAAILLTVPEFGGWAFAQTPMPGTDQSQSNVDDLSQYLACHSLQEGQRLLCKQVPAPVPPNSSALLGNIAPDAAFGTALSLHMANNLATEESTAKLLQGLTGSEAFGAKAAPEILRLSRSAPARYGLWIAVLGTGAIAVYESLSGGQPEPAASSLTTSTDSLSRYRLLGLVDSSGQLQSPSLAPQLSPQLAPQLAPLAAPSPAKP